VSELLVGTIGQGLWLSPDGADWQRAPGVPDDAAIYALGVDLAGGAGCCYRRVAGRWNRLPLPDPDLQVWAVATDPVRPSRLYAGCRPLALLRSDDGGARWMTLAFALPPDAAPPHTPRVTGLLIERELIWCGVEVGGVYSSRDDGASWAAVNDALPSLDIHALGRQGGALLAATPRGVARLSEAGWQPTDFAAPWCYCRALAAIPGQPGEWLCGFGDGPPGAHGAVMISEDDGRSWRSALFPGTAASTVWSVAVSPEDPDLALAGAIRGETFLSEDAGRSWRRLDRTFGEIRAVAIR
jgi:photosystem II stability/assembly factor-like uncharacterized protein